MTGPCLTDSETIELELDGLNLKANLRNLEQSTSATQGDYNIHIVTDADVTHTQTQTWAVDNSAGTSPAVGIAVVTFDPIYLAADSPGETFVWHAQIVVNGTIQDERNKSLQEIPLPDNTSMWLPVGVCVGQVNVPPGSSHNVTFTKTLVNTGDLGQYGFLMGGDKLVVQMGF